MRFDVISLFPELFEPFLRLGITRRAFDSGQVDLHFWPVRDFAEDAYRRVDDRPFGGGPGMVMMYQPLAKALAAAQADRGAAAPVIHFSPSGRPLTQSLLREISSGPGAVLLCGRYEGIDQRFLDRHVDLELSLGDFVLSGGELPALALLDGVARLQPGVLSDPASHEQDSFEDGLLDCPHFSRPETLELSEGERLAVPEVLLSGHHARVARWRREQSLHLTARRRPDLIAQARAAGRLTPEDERILASLKL
jgi:tRNA (guanine37-N1)-methyltransferase